MSIQMGTAIEPATAMAAGESPRLRSAAHEFEASLMKEFLKPLEHDSLFSDKEDGAAGDEGSGSAIMSFGSQALATAISERGGFGIANLILNHFRTASPADHQAAEPGHSGILRRTESSGPKVASAPADERKQGDV